MVVRDMPATSITIDEFEAFIALPENRDRLFELIEGEIVEKMPTQEHGIIAVRISTPFFLYLEQNPIGNVSVETRYRPVGDTKNDRLLDVSVRLSATIVQSGPVPGMPDIAVEIQSPGDKSRDLLAKILFYLANGAKIVFLILPSHHQVLRVSENDITGFIEHDTLDCGDLLPGFSLLVSKIFPPR